jgi:K+-sensing histidine kinase KdpD
MWGAIWPKNTFAEMSNPIRACSLAFFSISLAVGAAVVLDRYFARDVEVPLFLCAVAAAWNGRVAGAILSLVLSCISFDYFFVQPLHTLSVSAFPIFRTSRYSPGSRRWQRGLAPFAARSRRNFGAPATGSPDVALVTQIANAVKFTRTRPRAEIEIGCQEQWKNQVVVFVRDNGSDSI